MPRTKHEDEPEWWYGFGISSDQDDIPHREAAYYKELEPLQDTKEFYQAAKHYFSRSRTQGGLVELEAVIMAMHKSLTAMDEDYGVADGWWWAFGPKLGDPRKWLEKAVKARQERSLQWINEHVYSVDSNGKIIAPKKKTRPDLSVVSESESKYGKK